MRKYHIEFEIKKMQTEEKTHKISENDIKIVISSLSLFDFILSNQ